MAFENKSLRRIGALNHARQPVRRVRE
jgi:hypothetical protein